MIVRRLKIHEFERGLLFVERKFQEMLRPGIHWFVDPLRRVQVELVSARAPWFAHRDLDGIVRSGALGSEARVLELRARERAIVRTDGRFVQVLGPGRYVLFTIFREIEVRIVDTGEVWPEDETATARLVSPTA